MGVKDLWQVLAPVCERKSLWELQGKTVAIDLSGWVCDSQNVVEHSSQPNMHLRNLFFRTSCLLLLGALPVFVLEGDAPDLKLDVMSQRNVSRGLSKSSKNSGKRSRYKGIQRKCQEMLHCMGVHCVQSAGEAEALCAFLNAKGIVDGCISQDSDCFLYGGQVVYRNFTISASSGAGGGQGFSIDMYRMEQIEELLGLSRTKLIGLSLLCGCDYNQGGVSGVGKETAVKFLSTLRDDEVFSRFSSWRNDPVFDQLEKERLLGGCDRCGHIGKKKQHEKSGCNLCGTSVSCIVNCHPDALCLRDPEERKLLVIELNIRKKALQDENFPSHDVIEEFSHLLEMPELTQWEWSQPNLIKFMKFAEKHLNWDECYSLEKFLPLVTRWLLLNSRKASKCPILPEEIIKTRVLKGVPSYEVKWSDREGLFDTLVSEENANLCLTIEPQEMLENAFPKLVLEFNTRELAKKAAKRKGKTKTSKISNTEKILPKCEKCGKKLPTKNQNCICLYVRVSSVTEGKENDPKPKTLEDLLDGLSIGAPALVKKTCHKGKSSKVLENCQKLKKLLGDDEEDSVKPSCSSVSDDQGSANINVKGTTNISLLKRVSRGDKLSFEHLLEDEEWSVEDFMKDEEIDLSDIVQTITGIGRSAEHKSPNKSLIIQDTVKIESTPAEILPPSLSMIEGSSDEETPYTPLIERVQRACRGNTIKRTSILSSLKGRRFSDSFDAFCVGENTTSSPKTCETYFTEEKNLSGEKFKLGITEFLENSK